MSFARSFQNNVHWIFLWWEGERSGDFENLGDLSHRVSVLYIITDAGVCVCGWGAGVGVDKFWKLKFQWTLFCKLPPQK